ncbi:MAG: ATP-binding cassette domain-containing protein [Acidimicrobiales bacterium]
MGGGHCRLDGVRKSSGRLWCSTDSTSPCPRARKLVIVGPSGSGKTTILRVIMTLERPDDGTVEVTRATGSCHRRTCRDCDLRDATNAWLGWART